MWSQRHRRLLPARVFSARLPTARLGTAAGLATLGGVTLLVLAAAPAAARAQAGGYELPPHCQPAPPPPPPGADSCEPASSAGQASREAAKARRARDAAAKEAADVGPTPVGGYTLPRGGFAVKTELGYPNLDLEFLFAVGSRVQLGVGYRGLYTMNHTPYGSLKWSLNRHNRDVLGLALELRAGYSFSRDGDGGDAIGNMLAGEYQWFGELRFLGTARRGRHGLLWAVGGRVSRSPYEDDYYDGYGDHSDSGKAMGVVTLEIGYELRINRIASFFLSLGVDIFAAKDFIPALPHFRMGVMLGS